MTCKEMVDWLGESLDKDPARTLPLIGMDLNDGLGTVKKEGIFIVHNWGGGGHARQR